MLTFQYFVNEQIHFVEFEQEYVDAIKKVSLKSKSSGKSRSCFCERCEYPYCPMFMVHDELWEKYRNEFDYICISCFQYYLGRKLTLSDLKPNVPLNNDIIQILSAFV